MIDPSGHETGMGMTMQRAEGGKGGVQKLDKKAGSISLLQFGVILKEPTRCSDFPTMGFSAGTARLREPRAV